LASLSVSILPLQVANEELLIFSTSWENLSRCECFCLGRKDYGQATLDLWQGETGGVPDLEEMTSQLVDFQLCISQEAEE
jgi:hypothetical protein